MKGVKFTAREKERALKMWLVEKRHWLWVCHKMKCTRVSLWRWKTEYDGTLASLENKSSRPHSRHPNAHTDEEITHIKELLEENPTMGYTELYGEMRTRYAYSRHYLSMYKIIRKKLLRPVAVYEEYVPQPYETPEMLGQKWQMDVKYVPRECYRGAAKTALLDTGERYYQYTIIDEATRERFIYAYDEHSGHATCDFVKRAILYFGYAPAVIQTDNGTEFTNHNEIGGYKVKVVHILDRLLAKLKIRHQLIRPCMPRHNGKVERSHRTDQEKFYNFLTFKTFDELQTKMADWLKRYNNAPSTVLRNKDGKRVFQSPLQKRAELLEILKEGGNIERVRFLKPKTAA